MALGNLPMPGRPTIWMIVGQGPTVLAVGAGGGCLDIFTLIYPFSPLSPSLWEMARYRLKYCLRGPLNPKQPTNQNPSYKTEIDFGDFLEENISQIVVVPVLIRRSPISSLPPHLNGMYPWPQYGAPCVRSYISRITKD